MARQRSSKQLVSPAVDFQRIWSDRDARGATREGISIWRPNPPPGYCSLGERTGQLGALAPRTLMPGTEDAGSILLQSVPHRVKNGFAGDCITRGFDPPRDTTVARDADAEVAGTNSIPQLKPPRSFQFVWSDDSVRPEKALTIWMPLPPPGCDHLPLSAAELLHCAHVTQKRWLSPVGRACHSHAGCGALHDIQAI